MVGYAVSSFVDGFFKGRDWRDAKDQRKKDEERQARLDKMNEDLHGLRLREFGLREEEFGLRREDIMRQRAEQDRLLKLQAEDDAFRASVMATAPGATAAAPTAADMGLSLGVTPGSAPAAPQYRSAAPTPQLGFGAMGATPTVQGGGGADAARGGPNTDTLTAPAEAVRPIVPAMPMPSNPVLVTTGPGPTGGGITELYDMGILPRRYVQDPMAAKPAAPAPARPASGIAEAEAAIRGQVAQALQPYQPDYDRKFFQPGGLVGDVREIGNRVGPAALGALYDTAATAANTVNTVINPAVNYATGYEFPTIETAPKPVSSPYSRANKDAGLGGTTATGATPAPVSAAEKTSAASQPAAAGAAAGKEAVALTFGDLGLKPGERYTEKQVQTAAERTMQWFYETAAPRFLEHYVSTGQMDKATAYAEILESRAGKKAQERRASAAFKFINGDIDGWATDTLDAFKAYGYVDPTFDIDEEATGIIRDENGGFAGGRVVFKDRKTGNTMEKLFQTEDEMYNYGMVMTDPATVVDLKSQTQEQGALTDVQKRVLDDANEILKTNEARALQGLPAITEEEAMQMAMNRIGAVTGQGLGTLGASQGVDPRITGVGSNGLYREQ